MTDMERAFTGGRTLYDERGFRGRVGFGRRPAVLNIDLANAWTREGHAFSCLNMDQVLKQCNALNTVARANGVPVLYTTTAYDVIDPGRPSDMGLWHKKIPTTLLRVGSPDVEIDERVAPRDGDLVITKKRASAFHGTNLASMLAANGIDTVIVTGVTASGCVRHTAEDCISEGFRPIVVREAVSDRLADAVAWNLFDIDAKFGDVEPVDAVLDYLGSVAGSVPADAR